jgi:hypothetical protein|nr:MAG TPA: PhnA Zinc-Ribbon [Caudoviricetes sp.]
MSKHKCPKCGAPLSDWYIPNEPSFCGEMSDDRFRCEGHLITPKPFPQASDGCALNRTESCGYFGIWEL